MTAAEEARAVAYEQMAAWISAVNKRGKPDGVTASEAHEAITGWVNRSATWGGIEVLLIGWWLRKRHLNVLSGGGA